MTFEQLANHLQSHQREVARTEGGGVYKSRPWLDFHQIQKIGQFDLKGLNTLFDRAPVNEKYIVNLENGNSKAKAFQPDKIGNDFVAGVRRDTGLRRTSRIRSFVQAQVIAKSNGEMTGPLRRNTVDWMARLIGETDSTKPTEPA